MILMLGVWSLLRALFVGSATVALETIARRHQLAVLQRSVGRPRLRRRDRIFRGCFARRWPNWRSSLLIFPWYVPCLVPFLALAPPVAWIAFTGTVALAYTFFLQEPWAIAVWARVLEFAPLAAAAAWAVGRRFHTGVTIGRARLLPLARGDH